LEVQGKWWGRMNAADIPSWAFRIKPSPAVREAIGFVDFIGDGVI
jgi:hypothetical protein